jgi:hypothetical protein
MVSMLTENKTILNGTDPDKMTIPERVTEVAYILAADPLWLRAKHVRRRAGDRG